MSNIDSKEYSKQYWMIHKDERNEKRRKMYQDNLEYREKQKEISNKYHIEHKDEIREKRRKYYQGNKLQVLDKNRKYRQEHKLEINETRKIYLKLHKKEIADKRRVYRQEHKLELIAKRAIYNKSHIDEIREKQKLWHVLNKIRIDERNKLTKIEVMTHYGNGKCACVKCGYDNVDALSIDHINGGGKKHRKDINKVGRAFYLWLINNKYPECYQTLCMNCQMIKKIQGHEDRWHIPLVNMKVAV
jgi:hypothetical protein